MGVDDREKLKGKEKAENCAKMDNGKYLFRK